MLTAPTALARLHHTRGMAPVHIVLGNVLVNAIWQKMARDKTRSEINGNETLPNFGYQDGGQPQLCRVLLQPRPRVDNELYPATHRTNCFPRSTRRHMEQAPGAERL